MLPSAIWDGILTRIKTEKACDLLRRFLSCKVRFKPTQPYFTESVGVLSVSHKHAALHCLFDDTKWKSEAKDCYQFKNMWNNCDVHPGVGMICFSIHPIIASKAPWCHILRQRSLLRHRILCIGCLFCHSMVKKTHKTQTRAEKWSRCFYLWGFVSAPSKKWILLIWQGDWIDI